MLTNIYTRITFFQYGIPKIMEYNGKKEDAVNLLKRMYKVKPTTIYEGERDGFLPIDNVSTFNA